MQDKKLLNITHAVVGEKGVYSIEFHEDNHTTHVKRANGDMSETLFTLGGGGGGGTTDYIQTLQLIDNGLTLSSTGVGSAFNTTLDVTSLRLGMVSHGYLSGNSPSTVYVGGSTPAQNGLVNGDWIIDLDTSNIWYLSNASTNVWIQAQSQGGGITYTAGQGISISNGVISSTVTDTNTFISNVVLNGSDLEFTGTGGAFNGTVSLSSLSGTTENNIIAYTGGTVNTDTVSLYGIRYGAEKLVLTRSASTDVDFVLQGGTGTLGNSNFGIITVQVTLSCSGTGGILLKYKDLNNNNVNVRGGTAATSGNYAITFGYFGATGLQLIAANEY